MEVPTGRQDFEEADRLFRSGQYAHALVHLERLNACYPNTKNVLFPMAMCMERLGRPEEALPICSTLIQQFRDPRAQEMQLRLRPSLMDTPLDSLEIEGEYDLPDLGPITTVPVPQQEEEKPPAWKTPLLLGGALVMVTLILLVPFLLESLGLKEAPTPSTPSSQSVSLLQLGVFMISFMVFQGLGTGVASLALATVNKLPSNSISGVLLHVGGTLLGANIASAIISLILTVVAPLDLLMTMFVVEHVVMMTVFSLTYRFRIGDGLVFLLFFSIFMCVAGFIVAIVFGTGIGVVTVLFS